MTDSLRFGPATRRLAASCAAGLLATLAFVPAAQARPGPVTEAVAVAAARAAGERVRLDTATTELTAVFAEPDGRLTYEAAAVPQRSRQADGSWAAIDLGLRRSADGWLRPGVSAADVRFSAGGDGAAVVLTKGGKDMTMSWPGGLPAPTMTGDAATYAEVLPGVDLVLRATRTGFTHVLVVKHRAAAANPALREIRFEVGGDARIVQGADGTVRAIAGGHLIGASTAATAVMWDAGRVTRRTRGGWQASQVEPVGRLSTAADAGDRARLAKVGLAVDGGDLVLTPDLAMLTSPETSFPLYIDPPWDTGYSQWAYANSNNSNNEYSVARVGYSPGQHINYRSFFQFPVSFLLGKHIENAYVRMVVDHSSACTDQPTYMYHSWSGIQSTPRTGWSQTTLDNYMAETWNHANEGGGCSDSPQPDAVANFGEVNANGAGNSTTDIIQAYTSHPEWGPITVGFTSGSLEGNINGWKKFLPHEAKLVVNYSSYPGKPNGLQVAGTACPTSGRLSIGTLNPTLSAVYPDADWDQTLQGRFEWLEIPASGSYNDSTPRLPAPANIYQPAGGRATTPALAVRLGKAYAFRVRTTDPDPYNLTSPWSDWCEFAAETNRPVKPTITALTAPRGPGTTGTFRFTSSESDVTKFRYGWTFPPTLEVSGGNNLVVDMTVPVFGQNTLWVYAVDAVGNLGIEASYTFTATRPSPPVARWGLETYPGQAVEQALGGSNPLTGSGVSWHQDARLIGGQTAGVSPGTTLESSGPVVDTRKSFSVSAWYRKPGTETGHHVAVSQGGGTGAAHGGFALVYSPYYGTWGFLLLGQNGSSTNTWVYASSGAADWTHVTGVYDQPEQKARLYLNGELAAEADVTAPMWNANGKVQIGSLKVHDGSTWRGTGQVADVRLYNRVLVPDDFTGKLASAPGSGGFDEPGIMTPIQVGAWNFEAAIPCYDPSFPDSCEAPDSTLWGRKLTLAQGSDVGYGHRGQALLLDALDFDGTSTTTETGRTTGAVLRTTDSYTVSAWVKASAGTTVHQAAMSQQQVGTGSAFQLALSDQNRWAFGHHENPGITWTYGYVEQTQAAQRETWVHLVGVFDSRHLAVRFYVNGVLQGTDNTSEPWFANGPLVLGNLNWRGFELAHWQGAIDDVTVYQGAMSDAAVKILHEQELL